MGRQIRKYNQSGEYFACDLMHMTMSAMLHHSELDAPLSDYELDHTLTVEDIMHSSVIREEDDHAS